MKLLDIAGLILAISAALCVTMIGVSKAIQTIIVSRATAKKLLLEASALANTANQDAKLIVDLNSRLTNLQSSRFGLEMGPGLIDGSIPKPRGIPNAPTKLKKEKNGT